VTPLEFLQEELANVTRSLSETLRYDYGPEQGRDYYIECATRLTEIRKSIKTLDPTDVQSIRAELHQLLDLSSWISLIERSHLGEFSWPFSDELTRIALALFSETNLRKETIAPLIHVVAEGGGYQIVYESQVPVASSRRPFIVIAFQRSLKHHPLFHAIFGHELGHNALQASATASVLHSAVIDAFTSVGPLANEKSLNDWLSSPEAPSTIQTDLSRYQTQNAIQFELTAEDRQAWLMELACDFIGLLLFGPAFLAAHRALLLPYEGDPYSVYFGGPTHPPYAVRHKMLVQMMRIQGWHLPVTDVACGPVHRCESEFLSDILHDPYLPWAQVLTDEQLHRAIAGSQTLFSASANLAYEPMEPATLTALVDRLAKRLPPVHATLTFEGKPLLLKIAIAHTLYAGWVYWAGRFCLDPDRRLSFFETNRLCDLALLQQRAINDVIDSGVR
jgi:hypothetical protein